jgi:micrococcal nuclease
MDKSTVYFIDITYISKRCQVVIVLIGIFLFASYYNSHGEIGITKTVIDGDTIDISVNGTLVRLRFAGIAAPELHNIVPCAAALGLAAKTRVVQLLSGQTVRYDSLGFDKYKRTIAMVYIGDIWISELLIKEGLARRVASYPVARADRSRLIAAEADAKAAHRGLWGP